MPLRQMGVLVMAYASSRKQCIHDQCVPTLLLLGVPVLRTPLAIVRETYLLAQPVVPHTCREAKADLFDRATCIAHIVFSAVHDTVFS